ncbi:MAG: hypothetical protein ACYDCL_21515 [Myxococcales bacterium]
MGYTSAQITYAATLLTQRVQGLSLAAAKVWVTAEQGVANNVLGVTYNDSSGQHLFTYPTVLAGIQAAANLFNTNPAYAPAKKAVAATKDAGAQLAAIAASPWNHPYYTSALPAIAAKLGIAWPGGGSSPAPAPAPAGTLASAPVAGSSASVDLASILGKSPSDPFTQADSDALYAWTVSKAVVPLVFPGGDLGTVHGFIHSSYDAQVGKTIAQAAAALGDTAGTVVAGVTGTAGGVASGAFAGLGLQLAPLLIGGAVLATVLFLGYKGIDRLFS